MLKNKSLIQAVKFLLTGLLTNVSVYLVYLLLTAAGMGHKTAMSLVFVAGVILSYNMNKRWTFSVEGDKGTTFKRFIMAYGAAYVLNLSAMWIAVDRIGLPHYWVQAVNIVVISALLFLAQKYWIFAVPCEPNNRNSVGR